MASISVWLRIVETRKLNWSIVSFWYNSFLISFNYSTDQSSKRYLVGTTAGNVDVYWSFAELGMHWDIKLPTINLCLINILLVLKALNIVLTSHIREIWSLLLQVTLVCFAQGFYC